MKVYVVGGSNWYASFLDDSEIVRKMDEADVVLFTGGEDITPKLYGAKPHVTSSFNTIRDDFEISEYNKALELDNVKLIIGVCRGSQLLCVLNGGLLIQDVTNHAMFGYHAIQDENGTIYTITSTHHQMQYPFNLNPERYEILYKAVPSLSKHYEGDLIDAESVHCEPEIVLYKGEIPCLAIQGHPEQMNNDHATVRMLNNLINSLLQ